MVFEIHDEVHPPLGERGDVMSYESGHNVDRVRLVEDESILVLEARTLTKLGQRS